MNKTEIDGAIQAGGNVLRAVIQSKNWLAVKIDFIFLNGGVFWVHLLVAGFSQAI